MARLDVTEERIEIAKDYFATKMTTLEVANKHDVTKQVVSDIISDPKFRRIIRERYSIHDILKGKTMSLRWDVLKINNWKEVCYDEWDEEKESGTLSGVTEALIHYTAFVKVYGITEKNWKDVYKRIHLHEKLFGPLLVKYVKDHDPDSPNEYRREYLPITVEDVFSHIGLNTNGGSDTWSQYKNHALSNFDRDVTSDINRFESEREKVASV